MVLIQALTTAIEIGEVIYKGRKMIIKFSQNPEIKKLRKRTRR